MLLLLAERRPADVEDVVQPLELDRAVDAQVRPRARGSAPSRMTSTPTVPPATPGRCGRRGP